MFKLNCYFIVVLIFSVLACAQAETKKDVAAQVGLKQLSINKKNVEKPLANVENRKSVKRPLKKHPIQDIFKEYNQTYGLKLELIKKVKSGILGKEITSSGELNFSKGNLRLNFSQPAKSLLIVNKNKITYAQKLDKEFGGHWQVYEAKKNKVIKSQILVGVIFGDNKIWSQLTSTGEVKLEDKLYYFFEPIKNSRIKNIKKIGVVLTENKKDILLFKYWDHVENETTYIFRNIKKDVKFKKGFFRYKVPQNSELIYL